MGSMKLLLSAIAVLAVAGAAYLLSAGGSTYTTNEGESAADRATESPSVTAPPVETTTDSPPDATGATRATVEESPTPVALDSAAAKSSSCDVTGRVVDEAGRPLAGVPVAIATLGDMVIIDADGQRQGPREKATKTGNDGRFALKDVVPGFGTSVRAAPEGLVAATKPLQRQDGGTLDVGDLVCEVGGTLVGRVVSDAGTPIAGAEVRAWTTERASSGEIGLLVLGDTGGANAERVITDGSGGFRFTGMKPGDAVVSAVAEGFTRESVKGIAVKKGETSPEVKVALGSGLSIEGLVVDAGGRPLDGAKISILETVVDLSEGGMSHEYQKSREVTTDAGGNFRLGGLKPMAYHVTATAEGHYSATRDSVAAGTKDVRVTLEKSGLVYGYVRDVTNNSPVSNFEVRVNRNDSGFPFDAVRYGNAPSVIYGDKAAKLVGAASSEGLFAIPSSPSRSLRLDIEADGYATGTSVDVTVPAGDRVMRDIELTPEIRLSGIVMTPAGDPLPDAIVSIDHLSVGDANGGFAFRARAIRAEPGGDIHFDGQMPHARSDAEGRFTLKGLKPGDFEVRATHEKWAPAEKVTVKLELGRSVEDLELVVSEAGVLAGVAHDAEGKPTGGLMVSMTTKKQIATGGTFLSASSIGGDLASDMNGRPLAAKSNPDGTYRIDGIEPGDYFVTVKKPADPGIGGMAMIAYAETGGDKPKGVPVTIEAGQETQQDLFVPPTGRVRGTVTEATGPVAGVSVSLEIKGGFFPQAAASGTTDDRGHFELSDVEPGEYTLKIKPAGAAIPVERKVEVRARETIDEDLLLPTGAIRGQVRDRDSNKGLANVVIDVKPHRDAAEQAEERTERRMSMVMINAGGGGGGVQTMTFGDEEQLVKTDADGNYELKYLAAGDYDIEIRGGGVAPEKKERVAVGEAKVTEHVNFDAIRGATLVVTAKPGNSDDIIQFIMVEVTSTANASESRNEASGGNVSTIEGLKPGTYKLKVTSNDIEGETTVTVVSGETKPVEVTLE
jgi:protocatechuate 3,4-dioxygenase beta subunit